MTRVEWKAMNVYWSVARHAFTYDEAKRVEDAYLRAHRGSNGTRRLRRKYGRNMGRRLPRSTREFLDFMLEVRR